MDITPVIEMIEGLLEKSLVATDKATLAVDVGRVAGAVHAMVIMDLMDEDMTENYMAQLRNIMAMIELKVIDV